MAKEEIFSPKACHRSVNIFLVRKFLVENNKRYGRFRNFPFNEDIKKKLTKLEHFNSLMYYLYVK